MGLSSEQYHKRLDIFDTVHSVLSLFLSLGFATWGFYIYFSAHQKGVQNSYQCNAITIAGLVVSLASLEVVHGTIVLVSLGTKCIKQSFRDMVTEEERKNAKRVQYAQCFGRIILQSVMIGLKVTLGISIWSLGCQTEEALFHETVQAFVTGALVKVGLTIAAAVITFALMLLKRKAILQELDSYQQLDQRDSQ